MTSPAALQRILAFRLTTADPQRLARFYADGLGFSIGAAGAIPAAEIARLGLSGKGARLSLTLGEQRVDLDRFERPGRPYPADATAADLAFQHLAIVTTDIVTAYGAALTHGAAAISTGGPVALPPSAASVIAVKFRDPEGHPLEFLQFTGDRPKLWRNAPAPRNVLGVDHSAISVADASAAFYQLLGLRLGRRTLNHGPTQAALDGLTDPLVDVIPLEPAVATPHLELLKYRHPQGRPAPASAANDIAATRIVWASNRDEVLRDPDGHLHLLEGDA